MYHPLCAGGGGDIFTVSDLIITPFNRIWWSVLLFVCGLVIILWALRRKEGNRKFLSVFGVFLTVYLVVYKTLLAVSPDFDFHIWNELPLQPCNLIAILAIFSAGMGESWIGRSVKGFCFYGGIVFGTVAMAMPVDGFSDIPVFSAKALGFYGFHGLVIVMAASFASLGIYRPRIKDIPGVLLLLVLMGGLAHGANHLLRMTVYPEANYFYTYGIVGNVVMDTLMRMLPIEFFWMLPLILLMAALCVCITETANALEIMASKEWRGESKK